MLFRFLKKLPEINALQRFATCTVAMVYKEFMSLELLRGVLEICAFTAIIITRCLQESYSLLHFCFLCDCFLCFLAVFLSCSFPAYSFSRLRFVSAQMTSSFAKVRKNGVFLAGEIRLDRLETIRVAGDEEGNVNGLNFTVPNPKARITDHWRGTKEPLTQTGHFHVISLYNGLRFPLPGFILELLHHYDIAFSQLAPNAWRILAVFYLGCHTVGVAPTSHLFRSFYFLKTREEFYFL